MSSVSEMSLKVDGMHCASCVANIERTISSLTGVSECTANLASGSARVNFDRDAISTNHIIDEFARLGFPAEEGRPDLIESGEKEIREARVRFKRALIFSLPLFIVAMVPMALGHSMLGTTADAVAQAILAALVLFHAGREILSDAVRQSVRFRANMNSLIAMGTMSAFIWSLYVLVAYLVTDQMRALYFESVGMIITLILLGRFLEARSKSKAGEAVKTLMRLTPTKTTAVINGVEIEIEAAAARNGMILLVRPGERIPADGNICEGTPVIDESIVTGESVPVEKKIGDTVIGGSLNGNKSFSFEVTASGEHSYLARIVRMVEEAQSRKAPIQKLADKVAGIFVPVIIGLALITLAAWYIFAPDSPLLISSVVSVLIVACPCALGLATPTAVLAGTGLAAREGIIIRGGDALEALTKIDTIIFDKTGTITHGQLHVADLKSFGQVSERNLLRMVGSAELQSEHPLAGAIVDHMKLQQIEKTMIKNLEARPGFGIAAECDGRQLVVGNAALMESENISLGQALRHGQREMEKGRTVVFVALDGQVIGVLSLADRLRDDAREVVMKLKEDFETIDLISGDTHKTVAGLARLVGLDNFQAEVKPDQKKLVVDSYRKAGYRVAMVGDGINDAPALAAADVGIAIGTGTDTAIETADVILARSELSDILKTFRIARQSIKIIRQNLFWAFFYNLMAVPIAAGALYPSFGLTLSPMVAAAAMALSSIFVVTNSLRLNRATVD